MGLFYYIISSLREGEIDNSKEDHDMLFSSEEEAREAAEYAVGCMHTGAEVLHLSDPTDYPDEDADTDDISIEIYEE